MRSRKQIKTYGMRNNEKSHAKGGQCPTSDQQIISYTEWPQWTHVPDRYGDSIVALEGEGTDTQ